MSPETMFILGLLSIAAMLLTTGFLLFSKGASDYKNPELTRDYHKVVVTYLNRYGKARTTHRIGIDAPKDYLILREELLNQPQKETQP